MAEVLNRSPLAGSLPLGAHISCTTTHGDVLRGNIIATDDANKAIVIKSVNPSSTSTTSQSTNSAPSTGDIYIINLQHVSDVNITPQPQQNGITTDLSALPRVNVAKVDQRVRRNVADRWREINSKGVNVTEEAQQLFDSLRKLYDDIHWDRDMIVIMNDVRVSPPYTPACCSGRGHNTASTQLTARIQMLVTKFNEDLKKTCEDVA